MNIVKRTAHILALALIGLWSMLSHAAANETRTYYITDAISSVVAATDANGNTTWTEDYLPYGERRNVQVAAEDNQRWFTGAVQNPDTHLVSLHHRYYDPRIGRFLSIDPVGASADDPFSFNRYAYANNNPYRFTDPNGMCVWDLCFTEGVLITEVAIEAAEITYASYRAYRLGTAVAVGVGAAIPSSSSQNSNSPPPAAPPAPPVSTPAMPPDPDDQGDGAGNAKPRLVSNPKHHMNSKSPEPRNVKELYRESVRDNKGVRWAMDQDGTLHRFPRPRNNETHWNGSTSGNDPIRENEIPSQIRRYFKRNPPKASD